MAPPAQPQPRSILLPVSLIGIIFLLGLDFLHLQIRRNGYLAFLTQLVATDEPLLLPDSEQPILRTFTGWPGLDRLYVVANVLWTHVTDGQRPELSLFAFCFGGQLVPFLLVVMVESQRVAPWSRFLDPILWGFLMQGLGFGVVAPVFFIVQLLLTSKASLASTVRLRDPASLQSVVPAFLLGYFALTVLLAFPFSDTNVRQWCNAIWQGFPMHVVFWQFLFTNMAKRLSLGQDAFMSGARRDRIALDYAYGFAWNVAVFTQMATYAVLLIAGLAPGLLPSGVAARLTLSRVFFPGPPHSSTPMRSPGEAVHDFFVYDLLCGSTAALTWAVWQLFQVRPELASSEEKKKLGRGILNSVLFAGPGGALVALMQHRDGIVLVDEVKAEKSQ